MMVVLFVLKICLFLSITFVFAALGVAITIDVKKSYKSAVMKEDDLLELEHRYGKEVRATVEDIFSGEGKRRRMKDV